MATLDIAYGEARLALQSPAAISALVGRLGDLSPKSIKDLGPLVFDVLKLDARFPKAELLQRMLNKRPEWIGQEMDGSYNLLAAAIDFGHLDLVDMLIEHGVDTTYENKSNFSVLDYAARLQAEPHLQLSCANSLLRAGAHSSTQKDQALKGAAIEGNLEMVKSLLAHGAGFSVTRPNGTALDRACSAINCVHQIDIVQALLQAPGVDQVIDHGWNDPDSPPALYRAASMGNVPVISLLLAAGARVNPPEDLPSGRCRTPLMVAAQSAKPEVIDLLIRSGADVNATDSDGFSALHRLAYPFWQEDSSATATARLQALDLLFEAGADPTLKNNEGLTPIDRAEQSGNANLTEKMMALVARKSSANLDSATPAPAVPRPGPSRRL